VQKSTVASGHISRKRFDRAVGRASIPPATYSYRLGNRSALDWVIDQYQLSTDKRSGITSDPNRIGNDELPSSTPTIPNTSSA